MEQQSCVDDFRVVEDQQAVLRQQLGQVEELSVSDCPFVVDKEFRLVAPLEGIAGDAFVGQGVVVLLDGDVAWIIRHDDCFV